MLAILNFLNAHNLPIFQPILMILVSKFMVHRALSDKLYLSLGLLSPLRDMMKDTKQRCLYRHEETNKSLKCILFGSSIQFYLCSKKLTKYTALNVIKLTKLILHCLPSYFQRRYVLLMQMREYTW